MKRPIDKGKCVNIGYIKKTHGVSGDVMVVFPEGLEETYSKLEYLFFEVDGLLVPFFIMSVGFRSDTAANIHFQFLESQDQAKQFVACSLFVEQERVKVPDRGFSFDMLSGFILMEKSMGQIGPVIQTDDFGGNRVLTVKYQNREVMIPFSEDLVVKIDRDNTVLIMELPEGILLTDP